MRVLDSFVRNDMLAQTVHARLLRYPPLRATRNGLRVATADGKVILTGVVRSRSTKATAEQLARNVAGVRAVDNMLFADDELEVAVAQVLAEDARTSSAFPGLLVGVVFGVVYLKGIVASSETKKAAGEIAAQVPGVTRVSNELGTSEKGA